LYHEVKDSLEILRLLQLNLFEKRDLMALLRGDPIHDKQFDINQMALLFKSPSGRAQL